jgi:hypothetical protein
MCVFTFWFEEFQVSGVSAIAHPLPPKGDLPYVFTFFEKFDKQIKRRDRLPFRGLRGEWRPCFTQRTQRVFLCSRGENPFVFYTI